MPNVTVYFATNRMARGPGADWRSYGPDIVAPTDPSMMIYAAAFVDEIDLAAEGSGTITAITKARSGWFHPELAQDLLDSGKNLLVFVHGFANSFSNSITRAAYSREWFAASGVIDADTTVIAFSWPSLGQFLAADDYLRDQDQAGRSGFHIASFFRHLQPMLTQVRANGGRAFLLVHGMGNYALQAAAESWISHGNPATVLFDEVFLPAADERYDSFEFPAGARLSLLADFTLRISIYHSVRDIALYRASTVNLIYRLGQEGPKQKADTGRYPPARYRILDCADVDDYDLLHPPDASHQYYRRSRKVRADIAAAMGNSPNLPGRNLIRPYSRVIQTDAAASVKPSSTKNLLTTVFGERDQIQDLANTLSDLNSTLPPVAGRGQSLRIQDPDKSVAWGITRRDGKHQVVILIEREDGPALEEARRIEAANPSLVEIRVVGQAHSSRPSGGKRPPFTSGLITPGASIGHIRSFPGTLGCVVKSTVKGEDWIGVTSASHVLGINNEAKEGDVIIAPGHPDKPKSNKWRCGILSRFIYLTDSSKNRAGINDLNCPDIALVQIDDGYPEIPDRTEVAQPNDPSKRLRIREETLPRDALLERLGKPVYKVGRTTGLTKGTLDMVGLQRQAIKLPDNRLYMYTDVITVTPSDGGPFSASGDSGALVYTEDGYAIGFVIAGTDKATFVSPIDACLEVIEAKLI